MIPCKYLKTIYPLIRKAYKILYNIKQSFFLEHSLKESVKLCILSVFITSILSFPLHEAVFARSDSSCLRSKLVTHNTNSVINKHRRNFQHIITKLSICFRRICFFTRWRFKFNQNNRKSV